MSTMMHLTATGYHVTYAEDTTLGGWWADLRDAEGRVRESGNGATQDAARLHLLERVERAERERGDHAPAAAELPKPGLEADVETLSADMADVLERLDALDDDHRGMTLLIRCIADLYRRAFPDSIVARDGDGPRQDVPASALAPLRGSRPLATRRGAFYVPAQPGDAGYQALRREQLEAAGHGSAVDPELVGDQADVEPHARGVGAIGDARLDGARGAHVGSWIFHGGNVPTCVHAGSRRVTLA